MIIGFCGRMRAGKSTLSEVCEQHGFKRLAFADQLKGLCANLLGMSLDELNNIKNNGKVISFDMGSKDCIQKISDETGISVDDVRSICDGKIMVNARKLLQFVGTELIRRFCPNWHIDRTMAMIDPSENYAIDDVRFQNEKAMIEKLGGRCWFVVRPSLSNISNHTSENDIKWQDCWNNVIVNDIELDELKRRWGYILNDYEENLKIRDDMVKSLVDSDRIIDSDTIDVANMMLIPSCYVTYRTHQLTSPIDAAEFESHSGTEHTLKLELKDGSELVTSNPLEIEDLKFDIVKSDLTLFN